MCPLKAGGPRQLPAPPAAAAARAAACAAASSSAHSNSSGMVAPPHGLKSTIFTRRDAVTCTSYTSAKPKTSLKKARRRSERSSPREHPRNSLPGEGSARVSGFGKRPAGCAGALRLTGLGLGLGFCPNPNPNPNSAHSISHTHNSEEGGG